MTLTAAQTYDSRFNNIQAEIAVLQKKLEAHNRKQAMDQKNWGHAGDLAHVESLMNQINSFLGN